MNDSTQRLPDDPGTRRPRNSSVRLDSDISQCASNKPDESQSSHDASDNDIHGGNLPPPDWCEDTHVKHDVVNIDGDSDSDSNSGSEESYQQHREYRKSGMTDDDIAGFEHRGMESVSSPSCHSTHQRNCQHSPYKNCKQSPPRNQRRRKNISIDSSTSSLESASSVETGRSSIPRKTTLSPGELHTPIMGYETIEARSKYTVFKIHVKNNRPEAVRSNWFVFKRYREFVELNDKLKKQFPAYQFSLPPKRWFRDNFDADFLDSRRLGLQLFMDNITGLTDVCNSEVVRDFFCTDCPPLPHESLEESRALCDLLEQSMSALREQLEDKNAEIVRLRSEVKKSEAQVLALLREHPTVDVLLLRLKEKMRETGATC